MPLGRIAYACYEAGMIPGENDRDLAALSKMLRARQVELRARSDGARDNRKPVELDQSKVGRLSRMDAMQDQQMALELRRRKKRQLLQVNNALKRIEENLYGLCSLCNQPIAEDRLEAFPEVLTCVNCS